MGYYIDQAGNYYEGDRKGGDQEVPQRPSAFHTWKDGVWFDASREKYRERRAAEYPPITDYIDGVVKGDQAQVDAYIQACRAVKAKYPKP